MSTQPKKKPLEKLEKPKKSSWGGKRKGSGRKPLMNKAELDRVKELIGQHGAEIDPLRKKERSLAILDVLYEEGVSKRNIMAIKEYLDRQLGRSKQGVDVTSKGEQLTVLTGFNYIKPEDEDDNSDN